MMLGSKGLLPPTDAYELLRCKAAPAILKHHYIGNFFLCIYRSVTVNTALLTPEQAPPDSPSVGQVNLYGSH